MSVNESASERLKRRLNELDFDFKKSLGQNFLVSDHVISKIIEAAAKLPFKKLLEIGPGLGSLTDHLHCLSPEMLVLELDSRLCGYWREKGLDLIETDALRWDWENLKSDSDVLLVSNLPYQISSSLVIDRCLGPKALRWMVLMFQKEVAQRITAAPASSDYGLLSVMAQVHFEVKKVVDASPHDFRPPPKVASRVLFFERKAAPEVDAAALLSILKRGFAQRRKKLVNNLKSLLANANSLEEWLTAQGLPSQARAEELSPGQWVKLVQWMNANK